MLAHLLVLISLLAPIQSRQSPVPSERGAPPLMQRTLADAPPYPWTTDPKQILANLQHAIRVIGLNRDFKSYEAMLHAPTFRRVLDVTSERRDDYYLVELTDGEGTLLGVAALKKNGTLLGSWPAEGTTPLQSVPDLPAVSRALSMRFGASRCYYYHTQPTNIAGASDPFLPLIAANGPDGRLFVDVRLNVYRESGLTDPKRVQVKGEPPLMLADVAPDGFFTMTKSGQFRTLELIGDIREDVHK